MICNANESFDSSVATEAPDQKAALETLLGRRVQDGEAVSVRTFEPATVSHQRRLEIASELRNYFAEGGRLPQTCFRGRSRRDPH
jgi:hypothetical protein